MNYDRIQNVIDIPKMQNSTACVVGTGASATLIANLVRSGIGGVTLIDPDLLTEGNLARQDHQFADIGKPKVEGVARMLRAIRPDLTITSMPIDITTLDDAAAIECLADVSLLVAATDSFPAQARVNQLALLLNISVVFFGLYRGGLGGEIVFWRRGLPACFRCICAKRYEAFERAQTQATSIDPPSAGVDIFAAQYLDAIGGQIIIGLLTRGADNRFGRLIDELGDRQFIQVTISPNFRIGDRDIVREKLGVPADNDAYFSWSTIAIRDPDGGQLPCPDCAAYRKHSGAQETSSVA